MSSDDAPFPKLMRALTRHRIVVAVLAPVVALVLFSGYVIDEKLHSYRHGNATLVGAKIARVAHTLARNIEMERGATALYLTTGGAGWLSDLAARRAVTDVGLISFQDMMASSAARLVMTPNASDFGLADLGSTRVAVDEGIDVGMALARYSRINEALISGTSRLGGREHSHLIAAYMDLSHVNDRLGRQRAIGASWLVSTSLDSPLRPMFIEARAERKAFLESFRGHASPAQVAIVDDILRSPVFEEIERLHDRALAGLLTASDAQSWQHSHLALAALVDDAEERLATELEHLIQTDLHSAQAAFYLVVAVVVVLVVFSLETLRRSERRATVAQEEARKLFRAVEQSPVSVMITDTSGSVEYINPAFTRMTGYRRDELVGRNPRLLRSRQTTNETYATLWRTIRAGQEWRGEIVNRRRDGTEYWEQMTIAPVKDDDDHVVNYIALKEDITEIRSLRQALEREHSNVRRILETTHDAIALIDGQGTFQYANPAFLAEFGSVENLTCHTYFEDDAACCPTCRPPGDAPVRREWRSGRTGKTYELTTTPVLNADGMALTLEVFHDITARKQAEEATSQAREAAELANRAKSEFLSTMSHELRTPLNAIIGFSEIIGSELLGPAGQPQYLEYANDINASGRHLLQLITDILDVSRVEASQVALREEALSPAALVQSALNMVRDRAAAGRIELREDIPDGLPMLWADERRIKQVLVAVIGNAVKFTPANGRVEVAVKTGPAGELTFAIADTGIGIAAEEFDKVLAPFGQVDSGLSRRYEGSGLGLPLSRKLMEMHGGLLDLDSQPGLGTTVTLHFPRERVRG